MGGKPGLERAAAAPRAAVLFALSLGTVTGGACAVEEPDPADPPDTELAEALDLTGNERVHRVTLGGRGAEEHVVPGRLRILAGDLVQFVALDHRVHTVTFRGDSLTGARADFLEETGQRASPPLLDPGTRFVVTFAGAPPGPYPFVVEGNGPSVAGEILVLR